ncbi:LAETG motif-containing sortase-dependent surface protein [Streptomyces sp. NPDC051172]|uniref:LAETG motif-containing sortase-dependent surface protein n=1 Tax=Streptomyces sp. NPDC051172 TaxID=3155796 RepID=UPI003441BCB3
MSSARRPLLTATAAGTVLCALWFVPSAKATGEEPARTASSSAPAAQVTAQARAVSETTDSSGTQTQLADTGSPDTTPYVVGGTVFLGIGAGFVAYSMRRERLGF